MSSSVTQKRMRNLRSSLKHISLCLNAKTLSVLGIASRQNLVRLREREQEIADHIDSAQIILLLMSPSFIASDQLYENEMMRAINRQESGDAVRVIPIAVRSIAPGDPDKTPLPKDTGSASQWQAYRVMAQC